MKQVSPSLSGPLCSDFEYNTKGQLLKKYYPYFEGASQSTNFASYTYTDWGAIETETTPTNSYLYGYDELSTTKTETNLSQSTTSITDAAGNMVSVTDLYGNTMEYTYNNQGLPTDIDVKNGGTTLSTVSMDYDILGNQTLLDDPDAGPTTYTYNGFGELLEQTDARGNTYTFTYDILGRMLTRSDGVSENTSYLYNTTNRLGMLDTVIHNNCTTATYTYDDHLRLTAATETIDGTAYTHSYAYNDLGQLVREQYPSGFAIRNQYNAEGFLEGITNDANEALWQSPKVNEFGNFTEYVLGNNKLTCTQEYDALGFLEGTSAINHATQPETVQNLTYEFSQSLGNLNWRKDLLVSGLTEDFDYDPATETKLESWQVVGVKCIYHQLRQLRQHNFQNRCRQLYLRWHTAPCGYWYYGQYGLHPGHAPADSLHSFQ